MTLRARNTRPIATGEEYLWAPFNVMQSANRAIRCYLYGDSTVEGGFNFIDWAFFLQQYLPDAVVAMGSAFIELRFLNGSGTEINAGNRPRITALESSTDAAQRWQDEVRKAIAAGR